jgi:hypothetical protein
MSKISNSRDPDYAFILCQIATLEHTTTVVLAINRCVQSSHRLLMRRPPWRSTKQENPKLSWKQDWKFLDNTISGQTPTAKERAVNETTGTYSSSNAERTFTRLKNVSRWLFVRLSEFFASIRVTRARSLTIYLFKEHASTIQRSTTTTKQGG